MSKQRKKYNRRRNFIAIPFNAELALAALTSKTVLTIGALIAVFGEDIYLISLDWLASVRSRTADEGPIVIGLAHGDLSVAEIGENLDAELTTPDDIIARERNRRPVRRLGIFGNAGAASERLNNGVMKRSKIGFSIGNGHELNFWARNQDAATLTTGVIFDIVGTLYGRWQR